MGLTLRTCRTLASVDPAAWDALDHAGSPFLEHGFLRALERSRVRPGERLALVGFGGSAHVAIQIARHRGCEVLVASRGAGHRDLARELGAA